VLLDMLLQAPNWKTKTLGMQCLFEGMAVASSIRSRAPPPTRYCTT